jgi:hypothetical protein
MVTFFEPGSLWRLPQNAYHGIAARNIATRLRRAE